jgi:hypothetical protein
VGFAGEDAPARLARSAARSWSAMAVATSAWAAEARAGVASFNSELFQVEPRKLHGGMALML